MHFNKITICIIYLLLVASTTLYANPPKVDTEMSQVAAKVTPKLLIKNISVIDPDPKKTEAIVNILIQDRLYEIATQDDVDVSSEDMVIDAQTGFLLGTLEAGKAPSFLILDINPYSDFGVLLDTKSHILLAVHQGIVLLNNIKQTEPEIVPKPKPKKVSWLAYNPPSFALPSGYKSTDWNTFDNKYFSSIFAGVIALDRQKWTVQDNISKFQVGDLSAYDGGEIRALRFGLAGALKFDNPWIYTIAGATNTFDKGYDTNTTDDVTFFDWRLDIPSFYGSTVSIGKQKEPISMERISSMVFLPNQERSVVSDALLPSRNIGIVVSGSANEQKVTWAAGVFNNWLEDDGSLSDNNTVYVGRTTWLPYLAEDEGEIFHLGLGLRYTDVKESLAFATEPEFNKSPKYIDSGFFEAQSATTYNLEASWRKGPYWLTGEYMLSDIDAPALENPQLSGYHVSAAWALTGEMREYSKKSGTFKPLSVARSVEQGGWGAWELTTRWSVFDGNDGQINAGKTEIFSVGAYWWLTSKFNLSINYRWINLESCSDIFDRCRLQGNSEGLNTRLLLFL